MRRSRSTTSAWRSPAGQFVALVGTSGSGKTTLLKLVNRLVEPDAGSVRVDGADIRAGPAPALRRGIGYVFQGIGLFPHLTVAANIAAVPRLLGWSEPDIAARVTELLALVDLTGRGRRDACRRRCRAGSGSASASPARWRRDRRSSCSTSRSARSTR